MRSDALGLFWQDEPVIKVKKEKVKRIPPARTWELPDYLPFIDEAKRFDVPLFKDSELVQAAKRERLVFDIECYANYFLMAFKSVDSGKIVYCEIDGDGLIDFYTEDVAKKLYWIMTNFTIITFNGNNYDLPIASLALNGKDTQQLKRATDMIITGGGSDLPMRPQDVLKIFKTKRLQGIDHIDLIEVAPLDGSLKVYAGRLHCPRMQDLPYRPDTVLTDDQKAVVRWYCINDLDNTEILFRDLEKAIELRHQMGLRYGLDLRSKSDAQIAEAVIGEELRRMTGMRFNRPETEGMVGTRHKYNVPSYITYNTSNMQWVLETVRSAVFYVNEFGRIGMPDELKDLDIPIGKGIYRMGIGGLHSSEKSIAHRADENYLIIDRDVASYYPRIILNLGLYPRHLGVNFLTVYQSIVERRLSAKKSGDKLTAETLKITVNGSFGKTGNKYSLLYEPILVVQTTITGQLALLMLIERLELAGFEVLSANTDGIVTKVRRAREADFHAVIKQWESDTGFETEEARYKALFSRDVNNYIALKEEGGVKLKGAYGEADLKKNPQTEICNDAAIAMLSNGIPVESTIRACKDIRKFVALRRVRGGAVKDGAYLGSVVRWYYSTETESEIVYAASGNKVPKSEGAKPLQDMPSELPVDINYDWYVEEAYNTLRDIGFIV
jgi:hypothetical protein